jgi:hypothetical protein
VAFVKGKSGNPGGRPKLPENIMSRADALAAFARLQPKALAAIEACLDSDDDKVRLRAAELVTERNLGRIPEAQPLQPDEGKVDTVDFVPAVVTSTAAE